MHCGLFYLFKVQMIFFFLSNEVTEAGRTADLKSKHSKKYLCNKLRSQMGMPSNRFENHCNPNRRFFSPCEGEKRPEEEWREAQGV